MKSNRVLKNCVILIIAPFLAWGLLFIMNDLSGLTASVLDIGEIQKVRDEGWDLAYKTENQTLEIFGSEKVLSAENVEVEVLYNPERIVLDTENISGENYTILKDESGIFEIKLDNLKSRGYEEGRFEVPYSGDETQILLGDSRKKEGEKRTSLSIGNLNTLEEHSILP